MLKPGPALPQHVRPLLLACVRRFLNVMPWRFSKRQNSALRHPQPVRRFQMRDELGQGDVLRLLDQREDFCGMGFHPLRVPVSSHSPGFGMALLTPAAHPFDRSGCRQAKPLRRRVARLAALYRRNQSLPQIIGKGCRHQGWSPSPAMISNQILATMVIPRDSFRAKNAPENSGLFKFQRSP